MSSSDSPASMNLKKPLIDSSSNSEATNPNSIWSTKTPDKPASLSGRSRNRRHVALSVREVRRSADTFPIKSSAKRQIFSTPKASSPLRLPEKFEILGEFFNGLDTAIRLLKLKGSTPTFTNITPKIESLTDRRFQYGHLAQLKYIFPEAFEIKRVLKFDETSSCMKPDLHITLNFDVIEYDEKKFASKNTALRASFKTVLADFLKAHPEIDEIPADVLPEPFNQSNIVQGVSLFRNDPPNGSMSELSRIETSIDATEEQWPASASHLSRSVRRDFKISSREKTVSASALPQTKLPPIPAVTENCSALGESLVPATPIKGFPISSKETNSTPAENASTPARLMSATPALRPSKRCIMMSPDDNSSMGSPSKLVRCQTRPTRSLNFDALEENEQAYNDGINEKVKDELTKEDESRDDDDDDDDDEVDDNDYDNDRDGLDEMNGASDDDDDILEILPKSLLQSIRDREKKAAEDEDPAISQAKRRRKVASGLPKLFDTVHFYFQSINRTVATKEDVLHKIIAGRSDIIDRREAEEQLTLMLELVPEWISERKASTGDLLIRINKSWAPESVRERLEGATKQEIFPAMVR